MKTLVLIAILLQAPAAANSKISGHLVALPNGPIPTTLTLRIYGVSGPGGTVVTRPVAVQPDGNFEISGVSPGEYTLHVGQVFDSPGRNFTFRSGDVTDIEVKVPAGIPARVVMADGSPFNRAGLVLITTTTVPLGTTFRSGKEMRSRADAGAGQFTVRAFPGENTISFERVPDGYVVSAMTYGNQDVLKNSFSVDGTSTLTITLNRGR